MCLDTFVRSEQCVWIPISLVAGVNDVSWNNPDVPTRNLGRLADQARKILQSIVLYNFILTEDDTV